MPPKLISVLEFPRIYFVVQVEEGSVSKASGLGVVSKARGKGVSRTILGRSSWVLQWAGEGRWLEGLSLEPRKAYSTFPYPSFPHLRRSYKPRRGFLPLQRWGMDGEWEGS